MQKDEDFINWDDIDLDNLLGDYTEEEVFDAESSDEGENDESPTAPPIPNPRKNAVFKCPLCVKTYTSVSGFRGHVIKKHERPDLKAHRNRLDQENSPASPQEKQLDYLDIASKTIPTTISNIIKSPFRNSSSSVNGQQIIQMAKELQDAEADFSYVCARFADLLKITLCGVSKSQDLDRLMSTFHALRSDNNVLLFFKDNLADNRSIGRFAQVFLLQHLEDLVAALKDLQQVTHKGNVEKLSADDLYTLAYIAGYMLKVAPTKCPKHLEVDMKSLCTTWESCESESESCAWILKVSRGSLKVPTDSFLSLIKSYELVVRDLVDVNTLSKNSLDKGYLTEMILCNVSVKDIWETFRKPVIFNEILIKLFLTVRGFALAKLLKKKSESKRRKAPQGGRSFRKVLKNLSNN